LEFWTCKHCNALTKNTDACWKCLRPRVDQETRELDLRLEAPGGAMGSVKWFSTEKGYGFIRDAQGIDHHFAVRDVVGAELPSTGDRVTFHPLQGRKGPRASGVRLASRGNETGSAERVVCATCGKRMVPRILTDRGSLAKSVCPFCGTTYKDFGWCFVASAVYGADSQEVAALRRFRDSTLRRTTLGRMFIAAYYKVSPAMSLWISGMPVARGVVRLLLNCFVARAD
jgi:cold shock CspA family protein